MERCYKQYIITSPESFYSSFLEWASNKEPFAFYNTNGYHEKHKTYDFLAALGVVSDIEINTKEAFYSIDIFNKTYDWKFGYLSYDVKNYLEQTSSNGFDGIKLPNIHFFCPRLVFTCKDKVLTIGYFTQYHTEEGIDRIFNEIPQTPTHKSIDYNIKIIQRICKEEYIEKIEKIKKHIQLGDIYEMNFCIDFYARPQEKIEPVNLYKQLNKVSPAPFSCLYTHNNKAVISSSPERFIKKIGNTIISQPIKGTAPRGIDNDNDNINKNLLKNSEKERSENIMIVDLVRNDLSRIACKNSVLVDELCGLYTFPTVHQLISTVKAEVKEKTLFSDIIKATFPPGSMTGAPKIKAMEIIEKYETTKRGIYSGMVGYISPDGDFDFNVVIRSIILNNLENYLSFHVGGAITTLSDPESEYNECLLKAKAMLEALKFSKKN